MVKNPVFRKITPGMDKWATPDTRSLRSTAQDLRRQNNPSIRPSIMEGDIRGSEYLNSVRKIEKLSTSAWKKKKHVYHINRVFKYQRRTSTGSWFFALLSCDFEQAFGQIVSIRIKTLGNTNMVALRLSKTEKGSLPVDVPRSKTSLLKLPIFLLDAVGVAWIFFQKPVNTPAVCLW